MSMKSVKVFALCKSRRLLVPLYSEICFQNQSLLDRFLQIRQMTAKSIQVQVGR